MNTHVLKHPCSPLLGGSIEQVPTKHASGWLSPLMKNGTGYDINCPNEPSVYLMDVIILTDEIRTFIQAK